MECKRHDLEEEKFQKTRDEWNEDRMKQLDFIDKRLRQKNEAKVYINNIDETLLRTIEYLQNTKCYTGFMKLCSSPF